jgi:hypothetical protein
MHAFPDAVLTDGPVQGAVNQWLAAGATNDASPQTVRRYATVHPIMLFALAGLAEIGGGYVMWLWLRADRPVWVGLLGGLILVLYGGLPTINHPPSMLARCMQPTVACLSAARWSGAGPLMACAQMPPVFGEPGLLSWLGLFGLIMSSICLECFIVVDYDLLIGIPALA